MGNWAIVIEGTGQHHNQNTEHRIHDADLIAEAVVVKLKEAGQNVTHASFICGGSTDVKK